MGRLKKRGRKSKAFRPWQSDFLVAYGAAALAAYALIRGVSSQSAQGVLAGAGLAAALGWFAIHNWRSGRNRWYGQRVEAWAVEQVGNLLTRRGLPWESGRWLPGVGDVDLVVQGKRGVTVVEVKSFNRWGRGLFQVGQREVAALEQARRQAEVIGADTAIVWLPRGRPTFGQRVFGAGSGGVRVVFGSPAALANKLRKS